MSKLTEDERETLAQAVVREFVDHAHHNPDHGIGVFDRSRCDRIVAPAVEAILTARLALVEALAEMGVREQWPPDEWRAALSALAATEGRHCHADGHGPCLAGDCPIAGRGLLAGHLRPCPGAPGPQHPAPPTEGES